MEIEKDLQYYRKIRQEITNHERSFDKDTLPRVERVIQAFEKQVGKKVICETVDEKGIEYEFEHYKCPNCKRIVHQRYKKSKEPMRYRQNYCVDCGQLLNWSDE